MIVNYDAIGHRVREIRQARGLTQMDVAEAAGVSRPFVTAFESGNRTISLNALCLMAVKLGASLDYLIFGKEA